MKEKIVLCILDGWGIDPKKSFDATAQAKYLPEMVKKYPSTYLQASEHHVGLPEGQMGNSEVGHMTIGLGRVLLQDLPKIDQAFSSGDIQNNQIVQSAIQQLKKSQKPCHLLGLLSPGGVHSHMEHIVQTAKLLSDAGIVVHVHGFLDGRDTSPKSCLGYVKDFLKKFHDHNNIHISSLCGRYYAMDRDNRWDRTNLAYKAIVQSEAPKFSNPIDAIENSYAENLSDEFVLPMVHESYSGMHDGDGIWMINFRSDRVRQILRSLLIHDFSNFSRGKIINFGPTLAMNEYADDLTSLIPSIFSKGAANQSLGEIISKEELKQLRVAETEKYAHVTFFLNGGREEPFKGEERIMIPSPKVTTYDLQPQMSAEEITKSLSVAMERDDLSLIVVNYANTDMVGHTGIINATQQAVTCVDKCIKTLEEKAIENNWILFITSDHGNAECMREVDGVTPHTAHTCNPVPLIMINGKNKSLLPGCLADIAPTILSLMNISQPKEMTGKSLLC